MASPHATPKGKGASCTNKDIDEAMSNICRCGTYLRIRAAIHLAAGTRAASLTDRLAVMDGANAVQQA